MNSGYHILRPAAIRRSMAAMLMGTALIVGCAGVAVWAMVPVAVRVDGRALTVRAGITVRELIDADLTSARHGDLIGVDGKVALPGGGGPPRMAVDGRAAHSFVRLYPGAVASGSRGRDLRERVEVRLVAVPIPTEASGRGPDVSVEQLGAPGLARITAGVASGGVVERILLRPPVPMKVKRRPFPPGTPLVALTFDDGPWPGQTERVLSVLRAEGVQATFFMVGARIRMAPALARSVVEGGHLVGNHTQTHAMLRRATPGQVRYQLQTGAATVRTYLGVEPGWFRAPGGGVTPVVRAEAAALGERIAGWTVDPADWRKPSPDVLVRRVVGMTRPGSIVLMHDGGGDRASTIAALPRIIGALRSRGYRFVTLDDLAP